MKLLIDSERKVVAIPFTGASNAAMITRASRYVADGYSGKEPPKLSPKERARRGRCIRLTLGKRS